MEGHEGDAVVLLERTKTIHQLSPIGWGMPVADRDRAIDGLICLAGPGRPEKDDVQVAHIMQVTRVGFRYPFAAQQAPNDRSGAGADGVQVDMFCDRSRCRLVEAKKIFRLDAAVRSDG